MMRKLKAKLRMVDGGCGRLLGRDGEGGAGAAAGTSEAVTSFLSHA